MGVARDCHGIMANDHIHKAIAIIFSTGRGQNLLTLQENQTIFKVTFPGFLRKFHGDLLGNLRKMMGK